MNDTTCTSAQLQDVIAAARKYDGAVPDELTKLIDKASMIVHRKKIQERKSAATT